MKKHFLLMGAALMSATLMQAEITPAAFTSVTNPVKDSVLPDKMSEGIMIYGDYNNDGLLDIFAVGGQLRNFVALLKNNGANQWEYQTLGTDMTAVKASSAVWIDYNNDGNLDLIYTGTDGNSNLMMAFKNKGADNSYAFEKDAACSFYGAAIATNATQSLAVLDANNDGWMDIAVVGTPNNNEISGYRYTYLYLNNKGVFSTTNVIKTFVQTNAGNIYAFDYNGDGLMDLGYNGYNDAAGYVNKVYTNKGDSTFEEFTGVSFPGSQAGALFTIDANNDGYQDFIQIDRKGSDWTNYGAISTFDGTNYATNTSCGITGGDAVASIGDVNNDGFMDIVYIGYPSQKIAYGNGDGTFTEVGLEGDLASRGGFVHFVDLNGDNVLDIHVAGYSDGQGGYRNAMATNTTADLTNAAPAAVENLKVVATEDGYKLSWDLAATPDDATPAAAIRFNVMATNEAGDVFALNPADLATGKQKVAGGYIPYLNAKSYEFKTKDFTNFYVQAIDGSNVGSTFATIDEPTMLEQTTIANPARKIMRNGQMLILKNGVYYNAVGIVVE